MRSAESAPYLCTGKQRFTNPQLANSVLRRRAKGHKNGEVYHCSCCRYWHIGRSGNPCAWQRARHVVGHAYS